MILTNQFIATKFQAPPPRPFWVARFRLRQKLEQGYLSGSRLTLICAPAGYGKTTLAVDWLQTKPAWTWLALDATDNDLSRFISSIITAVQKIDPDLGSSTLSLLGIPQPPAAEVIIGELINELSAVNQVFILVLDDYHQIHNPAVHDAMEFLIGHQPGSLHLVITSREDPAFPLGGLRARGHLTEIRARDLRFTEEEVRALLHPAQQIEFLEGTINRLVEITEGWAAGLQLAGLAIQNSDDIDSFLESFSGTHRYIISYMLEEVLRGQPDDIRSFLTRTAILERFNADLCTALMGGEVNSQAVLDYLDRSNLFLIPLDTSQKWYRYHHLFADVLRAGLDSTEECDLHHSAAQWFEAHELPAEAIPHYLAAKSFIDAGRLVHCISADLLKHGELNILLGWIQALPQSEIFADPELVAAYALTLLLKGEIRQAAAILQSPVENDQQLNSDALLAVKAWFGLVSGQTENIKALASQSLAGLASKDTIYRVLALISLGSSYLMAMMLNESTAAFLDAYRLGQQMNHTFAAMAGLANLAYNLYDMGQLRKARDLCQAALLQYTNPRGKPLAVTGMIDIPLSSLYLEHYELDLAVDFAQRGRDACQKLFSSGMMGGDAEVVLATSALQSGDPEKAFEIAHSLRQFAIEHQVPFLEDKAEALEIDLLLRSGDIRSARAHLEQLLNDPTGRSPSLNMATQIFNLHLLVAENHPSEALEALISLETAARRQGYIRRLIHLLLIKTAAYEASNRSDEAVQALSEAVRLAAPEEYFGTMLRAPAPAINLLPFVRSTAPDFVDRLLTIIHPLPVQAQTYPDPIQIKPAQLSRSPDGPADIIEPLSDQELRILRLLAAGLSNQAIAAELVISTGTVKWHVHNILAKLGAGSRVKAAALARKLNIIH